MTRIIASLTAPDGSFGSDPVRAQRGSGEKPGPGGGRAEQALGPGMEKWALGAYHCARIFHSMSEALR
jgi:hypothetical protein